MTAKYPLHCKDDDDKEPCRAFFCHPQTVDLSWSNQSCFSVPVVQCKTLSVILLNKRIARTIQIARIDFKPL